MATYSWSSLNGKVFDGGTSPNSLPKFTTSDIIIFDSVSAADISFGTSSGSITLSSTGVSVTLTAGFTSTQINTNNFQFADGSKLQIGDGSSSTSSDNLDNTFIGTDYNDYFDGQNNTTGVANTVIPGDTKSGDTVSYAAATSAVTINLDTGTTSGGAGSDKLFNIENAIGSSFSDNITGLATAGSRLDGGNGIDSLTGGAFNDTYVITAGDIINETSTASTSNADLVISSSDYTLGANLENLTLVGGAIQGVGNGSNNIIYGNSNGNLLSGGSGGSDTLIGGAGNDTYIVNTGDTVSEGTNGGTDIVYSSATFTLADNVENLRLTGGNIDGTGNGSNNIIYASTGNNILDGKGGTDTLSYQYGATSGVTVDLNSAAPQTTGGSGNDTISNFGNLTGSRFGDNLTGTTGVNVLTGLGGNDTLTSNGGGDTLDGGVGNDTYVVASTSGVIFKDAGGFDTLQASTTSSLVPSTLSAIESLTLTGTDNINGTGNSNNNVLTGNNGNNTLDGGAGNDILMGGGGTDILKGNTGNDTYIITGTSGGTISETSSSGGTDLVITNSNIDLTSVANVENVTVGTATINANVSVKIDALTSGTVTVTGNTLNNTLTGSGSNDTLIGGAGNDTLIGGAGNDNLDGGIGNDIMQGGAGNDTYTVDSGFDVITEVTGTNGGVDTVNSSLSAYTLGANLENLILTGTADINGTGNGLTNTLTGNSGKNTLDGGTGADAMTGNAGDDTYIVDNTGDTVTEGATGGGIDTILSKVTYTALANVENLTLTASANIDGTLTSAGSLTGNTGKNTLTGSAGADTITGGAGADTLKGNGGADTFVYNNTNESSGANKDTITDFNVSSTDKIDVSAIFGGAAPAVVVGTGALPGGGTPEVLFNPSTHVAQFDVDGNGSADFAIALTGVSTVAAGDFAF